MSTEPLIDMDVRAVRVRVFGRVQGLGIRPLALRLATRRQLSGSVANSADGVTLELTGPALSIERYLAEFASTLPAGATIARMEIESIAPLDRAGFRIDESGATGSGSAAVPLDVVVCTSCLADARDATDRRHQYPFASCTDCGPRYSIVEAMPYDRQATTMRDFALCPTCAQEYQTPPDRRFHAQTIACDRCGPQVRLVDNAGRTTIGSQAISIAVAHLREGRIVALKGLGGYQLLVDATSTDAVRRLRMRKQRKLKPLAVLVGSLAEAKQLAHLDELERRLLTDPAGPIVVVRCRAGGRLSSEVAPAFDSVGLLLPTTPLHALICEQVARPLVCTSGNREGEPLAYHEQGAEQTLHGIADVWLHHNRPIARPIDDSVVRVINGAPCILRLARGYAPLVLPLPKSLNGIPLVALGGEQKAAVALSNGSQAVLGPHIGDLTNAAACDRWVEQLASLARMYGVPLDAAHFVHDLHPDYFSTQWASQYSQTRAVQHHHAHIASVQLEQGMCDREVLGLAWDGTGYGTDATSWGGECLRATCHDFQRVASLRPFPLLGGELAVSEPWRVAVALVYEALGPAAAQQLAWPSVDSRLVRALVDLAAKPRLSSRTSSMGRLFDGIAALVIGVAMAGDDGRPAILLEQACDPSALGSYPLPRDGATGQIDWRPLVVAIAGNLRAGVAPTAIAMRFHRAIADLAAAIAASAAQLPLVTAGGVFQNAVLGGLLAERLATRSAGWHRCLAIPPGDGGLAAGQLAVAAARRQHFTTGN